VDLGAFSISLTVKDLEASRAFYSALGFEPFGGDAAQGWLILQNRERTTIGLFHGMFEKNMLTFNPGWASDATELDSFTDVRAIQRTLREHGIEPQMAADETTTGPASLIVVDPDGNPVLFDQHR
jgi:catechol 2,3-dioxygenase-like lactoylglutathione lyase family enzyme